MKIEIETIPHDKQRYPTAGDYWDDPIEGTKHILVSAMGDWRLELLVAIHELVESALCDQRGIPEHEVAAFDMANLDADEPGELPNAPYHREHMFAETIERLVAEQLGVSWIQYGQAVSKLNDRRSA